MIPELVAMNKNKRACKVVDSTIQENKLKNGKRKTRYIWKLPES